MGAGDFNPVHLDPNSLPRVGSELYLGVRFKAPAYAGDEVITFGSATNEGKILTWPRYCVTVALYAVV